MSTSKKISLKDKIILLILLALILLYARIDYLTAIH